MGKNSRTSDGAETMMELTYIGKRATASQLERKLNKAIKSWVSARINVQYVANGEDDPKPFFVTVEDDKGRSFAKLYGHGDHIYLSPESLRLI